MPSLFTCSIRPFRPLWEFLRIDEPVAQAGFVVVPFSEPAVVDDEQFDAGLRGFFGELLSGRLH